MLWKKKLKPFISHEVLRTGQKQLSVEANEVNQHIDMVARLSNLALRLYGWYIKNGHARNEKDEAGVKNSCRNIFHRMHTSKRDFMRDFIYIRAIAGMHLYDRIF